MADYTATLGEIVDAHYIAENGGSSQKTETIEAITNAPLIPTTVDYRYQVDGFTTSTWFDEENNADMTVTGLTESTFGNGQNSISGDGTNYGLANGPQSLISQQTFGLAFTTEFSSISSLKCLFGVSDDADRANRFGVFSGLQSSFGQIELYLVDNNLNDLSVSTSTTFDDGSVHSVVINKSGDTSSDISIYVDDMVTEQSLSVNNNDAFDHTNASQTKDLAFWARNSGSIMDIINADFGIFEFNTSQYSQTEREEFVSRRPEV